MSTKNHFVKQIFFWFFILMLVLPSLQRKFNFINVLPLKGAVTESQREPLTLQNWLSGAYQIKFEKYLNETFGFRPFFVRLHNQLVFMLFNKATVNSVIVGKENFLFEENYINAFYGSDFIGTDSISQRIEQLKFLQDTLSKLDKTLLIVFAAGKGTFYNEYFPTKYMKKKGMTNYAYYVQMCKQHELNFIDFNKFFLDQKNTSKYPLYPKYGIHWSTYGACLAADSMIKCIEGLRKIDMPNIFWNKIKIANAVDSDYDIGDAMNIFSYLQSYKMAYPEIQVQSDSGKTKPSAIVVADSYYWLMFGSSFTWALSDNQFWYYNKQIYPEYYTNGLKVTSVNIKEEILKRDVIILMATEATLQDFGWGFIEAAYKEFGPVSKP